MLVLLVLGFSLKTPTPSRKTAFARGLFLEVRETREVSTRAEYILGGGYFSNYLLINKYIIINF